jgi:xylose isomerase
MSKQFFPGVDLRISYEGRESKNPLAFKYYDKHQRVGEKTMGEHLRFAVAYWHTFMGTGADMFGGPSFRREWHKASDPKEKVLDSFIEERYSSFKSGIGAQIMAGKTSLEDLGKWILREGAPVVRSGRQELLENILNSYLV